MLSTVFRGGDLLEMDKKLHNDFRDNKLLESLVLCYAHPGIFTFLIYSL
jgi:hypothetical protein